MKTLYLFDTKYLLYLIKRRYTPANFMLCLLPSSNSRRYIQVQPNRKSRHFGRDTEIQAMDGDQSVVQCLI